MKPNYLKLLCLLFACLLVSDSFIGCSANNGATSSSVTAASTSTAVKTGIAVEYSNEDLDDTWDASTATKVTMNDASFAITGDGASAAGSALVINAAGTYVLSGSLSDGQIIVDAGKEDLVRLILNGVNLYCSNSAPIYSKQSRKTIVTLSEGTSNILEDGPNYIYAEEEGEPDAVIFSKDDLMINGSGSLTVNGRFNNGICSKDALTITGGSINITAVNDGLQGKDSIAINGGTFNIETGGDGLQANNDEAADKGWISLDGGVFNITAGNDGLQAETLLQVNDADLAVTTGGGSVNSSIDSSGMSRPDWGRSSANNSVEEDTVSAKGLKAGTGILIKDGIFSIDSSDDSIHCNSDIMIEDGEFEISSGDDGIHADTSLTVEGGSMVLTQCYEGLESASIIINDGIIRLTAKDDGFNAAGGNDGSSLGGRPGENSFSSDGSYFIRITGGYVSIDADGDGIDSNGDLYFDGGTVLVNGPTNNGNGPMDYNGTCEVTGGILAIAGSSGMAQSPGNTSSQNSLIVYYSAAQKAGTLVSLAEIGGEPILAFAPSKDYQSIVISTPDLEQGKTYSLISGGTSSGQLKDGLYTGGIVSGGTELTKVTISNKLTNISDDGTQVSGGMGGMSGQRLPGGDNKPGRNQMPSDFQG